LTGRNARRRGKRLDRSLSGFRERRRSCNIVSQILGSCIRCRQRQTACADELRNPLIGRAFKKRQGLLMRQQPAAADQHDAICQLSRLHLIMQNDP